MDIGDLRQLAGREPLERAALARDPFVQFERWFTEACGAQIPEPNAMSVGTADARGRVTLRTVLLKYFDAEGFVFFTHMDSVKARQIAENPRVALLFFWPQLERQLVIEGSAAAVSRMQTLRYFATRPRGSQLGAWVSHQSSIITSRALLEAKLEEIKRKFAGGEVAMPSAWGGFRVAPDRFEFWQGSPNRLHDRFQYAKQDGAWRIDRLAP